MENQPFTGLPDVGAWRLLGAFEGHEVVQFTTRVGGIALEGITVGVEEGIAWGIRYVIELSDDWHVRRASLTDHAGVRLELEADGEGSWAIDGQEDPELHGCLDVDLEASVVTNTIPVHRLALAVGGQGQSAAAYIRSNGLAVERLDQTYRRLPDAAGKMIFDYRSPRFGYQDTLLFGSDGLAVDYPGIGTRLWLKD
jgi:hypothetical protein